jgi:hypothetical protein
MHAAAMKPETVHVASWKSLYLMHSIGEPRGTRGGPSDQLEYALIDDVLAGMVRIYRGGRSLGEPLVLRVRSLRNTRRFSKLSGPIPVNTTRDMAFRKSLRTMRTR